MDEVSLLERLISASARALSRGFYDPAQTEAAVTHVFGVDTEVVRDGTYLVALAGEEVVGCGGWSGRRRLFGGDRFAREASPPLDPETDAARIRAFFTAPGWERRGVASALLVACEAAARAAGFRRLELLGTLPGVPFYEAHGFVADPVVEQEHGGVRIPFVPMRKTLLQK